MSKTPVVGDRKLGRNINYRQVFGPDIDDGIPFAESVDWLRQYAKDGVPKLGYLPPSGYYLIVGVTEDCPTEIWWGDHNDINKYFTCIYVSAD